ncbi:MAG TPA: nuclear transport factor 2 family protein [Pyrinomonadaceae bacterium]|jgi:ketosteroid isomerase-like protein
MKRILEIGIYKPGDLTSEVTNLDDVNGHVSGDRAVFTGHATVKSRFKGQDFSGLYQLTRVYVKQQERWQVVASRTARLGNE